MSSQPGWPYRRGNFWSGRTFPAEAQAGESSPLCPLMMVRIMSAEIKFLGLADHHPLRLAASGSAVASGARRALSETSGY